MSVTTIVFCLFLPVISVAQEGQALGGEAPVVRVTNIRRVFYNGEHNAFTDLIRFKGRFYLTFRSCPDGHAVHPTASIIVLVSDDTLGPTHRGGGAQVPW